MLSGGFVLLSVEQDNLFLLQNDLVANFIASGWSLCMSLSRIFI